VDPVHSFKSSIIWSATTQWLRKPQQIEVRPCTHYSNNKYSYRSLIHDCPFKHWQSHRSSEKSIDLIGNWTCNLPACFIVTQPATFPCTLAYRRSYHNYSVSFRLFKSVCLKKILFNNWNNQHKWVNWFSSELVLTFIVWTFKLPTALHGQTLNDHKSLNLQTFRKNCIFSMLCNIEIWSTKNLKDNKIVYIHERASFTNEN
jgi:hypothetical protein